MATNDRGREERRRRIMESGSDRIALITGRHVHNLPSSPPRSIDSIAGDSSLSSSSHDHSQIPHAPDPIKDTPVDNETSERDATRIGGQLGADILRHETGKGEVQPLASRDRTDSVALAQPRDRPNLFSSRQLNSCILESERTRAFCALVIAVLVVLSYVGYPLFGSHIVKSGSIIASRPLYILLLTDVTIVLARLRNAQKSLGEPVEEKKAPKEENQNWDGAVKVLERGLVAYQSIRAVFIDCSIYMVVVICGLSQV
ncbi:uncharacterized protein LOC116199967 [Punica granatum]|uniref:Uncharacterized protein n=2 Tax=Punica granatum TaxID=22663 RepID=A0A218WZP6_PUNGR|nr:uncharacterized protein LOC116199967 [Punica granatum]OWM78184.1 hypothetical protein CDL15_Pgr015003 [Punica granatum]PKI47845.1 hypothetical protein CRG98_031806 [Punica granatum]